MRAKGLGSAPSLLYGFRKIACDHMDECEGCEGTRPECMESLWQGDVSWTGGRGRARGLLQLGWMRMAVWVKGGGAQRVWRWRERAFQEEVTARAELAGPGL